MNTHTSTSNRGTRPKPAIRRNRDPPMAELPYIREERALNDSLIDRLHQEVEMRTIRLGEAKAHVEMKGIECENAELRLETAVSIHEKLMKTCEMFSLPENSLISSGVEKNVSGLEVISPNLLAVAESLNRGSDFIKDIDRRIEEARVDLRMAQDAVARSLEEEQDALLREEQCTSILIITQGYLDEISALNRKRDNRAVLRTHDEIWRLIFLEVVSDINDLSNNPSPAIAISQVSYSWRTKALAYPALWTNIYVTASGFSSKDAIRIALYRRRSDNKPLNLILHIGESTSDESLALLVGSVTDIAVNSMLITGDPLGLFTQSAGTHIPRSVLKTIRQLRKLEISYPPEFHQPGHKLPDHLVEGLEELVLRNCILTRFLIPGRTGEMARLVRLTIRRPRASLALRWDPFRDWIANSATTLEDLWLSTEFSQDQLPNNAQPVLFSRLACIRTTFRNILLLFNSGIHTPFLSRLAISRPGTVDVDAWRIYATDPRGGSRVTSVSILDKIGANDVESYSDCLKSLPILEDLALYDGNVEPLLEALIPREPTSGKARPLETLNTLTIFDYEGDGDSILLFAIQYQPESNLADPSSGVPACSLELDLENCPNLSSYVLQQLKEIESLD